MKKGREKAWQRDSGKLETNHIQVYKGRADGFQFIARATVQAFRVGCIAVQFYDLFIGYTGCLVQAVHILRDYTADLATFYQFSNCQVTAVGLGPGDGGIDIELASPGFSLHFLRTDKLFEIYGLVLTPDAARAAKIRNPRFGADACAGTYNCALAGSQQPSKTVQKWLGV